MTSATRIRHTSDATHATDLPTGTTPRIDRIEAHALARIADGPELETLLARAVAVRDERGHGRITYSPKVFIPITKLCRDVCHYCTFARPPRRGERAYLSLDDVLEIARTGAAAGCREALFTLGDKPELRYAVARKELAELGHETTISYLAEITGAVLRDTGLLPEGFNSPNHAAQRYS